MFTVEITWNGRSHLNAFDAFLFFFSTRMIEIRNIPFASSSQIRHVAAMFDVEVAGTQALGGNTHSSRCSMFIVENYTVLYVLYMKSAQNVLLGPNLYYKETYNAGK